MSINMMLDVVPLNVWLTVGAALCWGATNPFIRAGATGVNEVDGGITSRLSYLLCRWQYLVRGGGGGLTPNPYPKPKH